jgi:hypothetical protein
VAALNRHPVQTVSKRVLLYVRTPVRRWDVLIVRVHPASRADYGFRMAFGIQYLVAAVPVGNHLGNIADAEASAALPDTT